MAKKILKLSLFFVTPFFFMTLGGCVGKSVNTVRWGKPAITSETPEFYQVLTDNKLARKIVVEDVNTDINSNGFLNAQVTITNTTKKLISLEYKFEWIDSRNMYIDTPASRWIIKHIYGGDTIALAGTSPQENISDFKLKLKRR